MRRLVLVMLLGAGVATSACSGGGSAPRPAQPAPEPAGLTEGDLRIRASAVPTMQLPESVAREYGIARGAHRVLLLVALRRGNDGDERTVAGSVRAQAIDLQGRTQPIVLRELRTGDLVDHVGVLDVSPPETVRFRIEASPANEAVRTLEFVREFYP